MCWKKMRWNQQLIWQKWFFVNRMFRVTFAHACLPYSSNYCHRSFFVCFVYTSHQKRWCMRWRIILIRNIMWSMIRMAWLFPIRIITANYLKWISNLLRSIFTYLATIFHQGLSFLMHPSRLISTKYCLVMSIRAGNWERLLLLYNISFSSF